MPGFPRHPLGSPHAHSHAAGATHVPTSHCTCSLAGFSTTSSTSTLWARWRSPRSKTPCATWRWVFLGPGLAATMGCWWAFPCTQCGWGWGEGRVVQATAKHSRPCRLDIWDALLNPCTASPYHTKPLTRNTTGNCAVPPDSGELSPGPGRVTWLSVRTAAAERDCKTVNTTVGTP